MNHFGESGLSSISQYYPGSSDLSPNVSSFKFLSLIHKELQSLKGLPALSLISDPSIKKAIQTHQFNFSATTGPETGSVTPRSAEISSKRSLTVFK